MVDSYDAQDQCQLDVLHVGTGAITETDVTMAETFSGNVPPGDTGPSGDTSPPTAASPPPQAPSTASTWGLAGRCSS